MALSVPTPVQLLWGANMTVLYNDAFVPILTHKHPDALGMSAREVWAEVWTDVGAQLETVLSEGQAFDFGTCRFRCALSVEEAFFTFTCSPIRDADGLVVGLLNLSQNTTSTVPAKRKLRASERRAARSICLRRAF